MEGLRVIVYELPPVGEHRKRFEKALGRLLNDARKTLQGVLSDLPESSVSDNCRIILFHHTACAHPKWQEVRESLISSLQAWHINIIDNPAYTENPNFYHGKQLPEAAKSTLKLYDPDAERKLA